jgi:UPF0755 protein
MNDITPPNQLPPPQVPKRPLDGQPGVVPSSSTANNPVPASFVDEPLTLPQAEPPAALTFEKPKKKWRKWLAIILIVLFVFAAGAATAGYFWYKDAMQPISGSQEHISLEVAQGESADQVAANLQQKKLIKSAFALQVYIKLHNKSNIKAGSYVFTPSQGPHEIVQWLNDGRVDTFKLTILPGKTLAELKETFQGYGYSADEIDNTLGRTYSHPLLADKPAGTTLEGYVYPETYYVTSTTPLETVITQGFDLFENKIKQQGLKDKLAARGFNIYQGVTLASIIEKEVPSAADQRQVAQVFETRLQKGMMLGSDVTYHYGAALLGVDPSPTLDSPYNTRIHTGLPPGPISNFSIGALEAVTEPASGDYLFFVAGDDGVTRYAHTDAEHQANIYSYCKKLCASN